MNRGDLFALVAGQYAPLLTAAGVTAADTTSGIAPALDSVMRLLGLAVQSTDFNPTITAGLEGDAILLARYFVLDWLLGACAARVDLRDGDESAKYSQLFTQVEKLLARALTQVPSKYPIEPGDFAFGRLQLDILEPWYTAAANPQISYP